MTKKNLISSVIISVVLLVSCTGKDEDTTPGTGTDQNKSLLVTKLNGFQFEGAFFEPSDPKIYSAVGLYHAEEFNNGLRVVFASRDNLTNFFRWYPKELKNGKSVNEFKAIEAIDFSPENYNLAFHNTEFKLFGYEKASSNIVTFLPDATHTAYYVSKPNNHFPYHFDENYTVFFGNASSVYVHENMSHTYTPPAPAAAFQLTSEPSVAWADYLMDDDIVNPYSYRDNIYTGFFNATFDKNYIGIAKGATTLATLLVNNNPPEWYYSGGTTVYLVKSGSKIFLTLYKIKAPFSSNDFSVYEMDENEQVIRPVFENIEQITEEMYSHVSGRMYYFLKNLFNQMASTYPEFVSGAGVNRVIFGKTKIIIAVQKDLDRVEVYSKPY